MVASKVKMMHVIQELWVDCDFDFNRDVDELHDDSSEVNSWQYSVKIVLSGENSLLLLMAGCLHSEIKISSCCARKWCYQNEIKTVWCGSSKFETLEKLDFWRFVFHRKGVNKWKLKYTKIIVGSAEWHWLCLMQFIKVQHN